jgi:hypothetical protein
VNDIPVDLVVQQGTLVRVESQATQIVYEGRLREGADEIRGAIELGRSSFRSRCAARRKRHETRSASHPARSRERHETALRMALLALIAFAEAERNRCFAATPRTRASFAAKGPREFHRVKWTFPTGDRIVSSPVFADG